MEKLITSLYVHIPFCEHICFYCDFVKIKKPDVKYIDEYLTKLTNELEEYGNKLDNLKTIYIGGGTPSCLNEEQTEKMLKVLSKYVNEDMEYSIELNPESVTENKLLLYKKYGINRLSMGVQSFDNNLLKKIGRVHDNSKAIEAYKLMRKVGFDNVSFDLMYNLFDQKTENIETDLNYIKELNPDHISWYSLIMKERSVWGKQKKQLPGNDELFDEIVNEGLKKLGYKRYEVSNYSKPGKESKHNIAYWDNSLFAGVGVGASGFELINNKYVLTNNTGNYLDYKKEYEELSKEDYYFQVIMMGLRLKSGINLNIEENQLIYKHFEEIFNKKINENLLEKVDNNIRCTDRGYDILNEILLDFLS